MVKRISCYVLGYRRTTLGRTKKAEGFQGVKMKTGRIRLMKVYGKSSATERCQSQQSLRSTASAPFFDMSSGFPIGFERNYKQEQPDFILTNHMPMTNLNINLPKPKTTIPSNRRKPNKFTLDVNQKWMYEDIGPESPLFKDPFMNSGKMNKNAYNSQYSVGRRTSAGDARRNQDVKYVSKIMMMHTESGRVQPFTTKIDNIKKILKDKREFDMPKGKGIDDELYLKYLKFKSNQ